MTIDDLDIFYYYDTLDTNISKKRIGYMPTGGAWSWINAIEAQELFDFVTIKQRADGSCYMSLKNSRCYLDNPFIFKYAKGNTILYNKICRRMHDGDTLDRFIELSKQIKIEKHEKPSGLDRFITKIDRPLICRYTDNTNKDTFDYIDVDCYIIKSLGNYTKSYIKEHNKDICKLVLDKINNSKAYQKYGVPINFLKLSRETLLDGYIEFRFELKDINL